MLRACRELGISTVAVHSTADANAMHVRLADESVHRPAPARQLSQHSGHRRGLRDHRGRGGASGLFPRRETRFAEILAEHGITFIGPSAEHIRTMGDKIEAKRTAQVLGIPVVARTGGGRRRR